ncbi:hypothetical protein HBA53_02470 [Rhodococcus pyridinivorans]|uniref:hypothetical protein n=1 Tax=Rhodococcus pyridinivorans TaxID=103816 RepID=UPI001C30ECA2|nr:hypothetical protein [Rhodococcus pyridinivorans]QXF80087.1 hypothetical protein HBA53_02470 [Rhodococcus pyridinivorans]
MSSPVVAVEESTAVLVEYCCVPQVSVVLFPGVSVAVGGVALLGPVGGMAGRPVTQNVRGRAVTRDQYLSAGRMHGRALPGRTR